MTKPIRHYARSDTDSLSIRSVDMPNRQTAWIIDDDESRCLDTRTTYASKAMALKALADHRLLVASYTILWDSDTDENLGPATPEQAKASASEPSGEGLILIDDKGDVVTPGSWTAQQPGVRRVYVG